MNNKTHQKQNHYPSTLEFGSKRTRALAGGLTSALAVALLAIHPAANAATLETIATGLNNPRGLNFGPEGALYVAEAGLGGDGDCAPGPEGTRCYGTSGSITRLDLLRGTQERISTGLPSLASADGSFATGPHDIVFAGRGNATITIGFGGNPLDREVQFPGVGDQFARLARVVGSGNWSLTTHIGEYEISNNPTGDEIDSNPYGLLALPGRQIVADAGANALNQIAANGSISTLAVFPDRMVDGLEPGTQVPMDAVPTTVALGPDGHFYVGQLTGFPFPVGGANIYRVPSQGGTPEVFASGFTHIIDIAFGAEGSLYVLQIAKNGLLAAFGANDWTGSLVRINTDGTRTEIASEGLFAPGGITIGPDGTIYVTNNSISGGNGEVVKIVP